MIIWKRVKICEGLMEYHAFFNGVKVGYVSKGWARLGGEGWAHSSLVSSVRTVKEAKKRFEKGYFKTHCNQ